MMKKPRAQILVFTVLLLLIVSLTVISITSTTTKNTREVFFNLEYEKSYNYAEAETLANINTLSNPRLDLGDLAASDLGELDCQLTGTKLVCGRGMEEGARRVVLSIFETNLVENYDLSAGDYFDVILSSGNGNNFYNGSIDFRWVGESAFDVSLIYLDSSGDLQVTHEIVDPKSVYTSSASGFLSARPTPIENSLQIDLTQVNSSIVPSNAIYKYLRIKSISRNQGTSITIRPVTTGTISLPNQVRRVEAFSYLAETPASPAPVVLTQLPLSPQVPAPLTNSITANALTQPICGNSVREGKEVCDDGNSVDNDSCTNACCAMDNLTVVITNSQGDNVCGPPGMYVDQSTRILHAGWSGTCDKAYEFYVGNVGEFGPYGLEDSTNGDGDNNDWNIGFTVTNSLRCNGTTSPFISIIQ
jgi:cysteine-rich repeat protein